MHLHHQKRKRARCSNHDSSFFDPGLNVVFLRAAIEPWTRGCRMARGDQVRCAVRIVGIGVAIVGVIGVVARIVPSVERADGSNNREEPCDNEGEPKEEVAANVGAGMYWVGSRKENANVRETPYQGK